jgi:predicted small secreted protein
MRQISYAVFVAASLFTTVVALSACNTVAGAGQDVQRGGQDLENSAVRNGAQPAR